MQGGECNLLSPVLFSASEAFTKLRGVDVGKARTSPNHGAQIYLRDIEAVFFLRCQFGPTSTALAASLSNASKVARSQRFGHVQSKSQTALGRTDARLGRARACAPKPGRDRNGCRSALGRGSPGTRTTAQ